jgi:thiamine pyrophosphokinase
MAIKLRLPQVDACTPTATMEIPVLLVAGGRSPDVRWLRSVAQTSCATLAVDKGAEYCKKAGLVPHLYVGDKDSADMEVLQSVSEAGVEMLEFPSEKDLTDLQLALSETAERFPGSGVLATGVWGGRFDHLFSAVFSMVWSCKWGLSPLGMADEKEVLLFLQGPERIILEFREIPRNFSLLALSGRCGDVSVEGVRWELHGEEILLDEPYAISNEVLHSGVGNKDKVEICFGEGMLGVYMDFWSKK